MISPFLRRFGVITNGHCGTLVIGGDNPRNGKKISSLKLGDKNLVGQ